MIQPRCGHNGNIIKGRHCQIHPFNAVTTAVVVLALFAITLGSLSGCSEISSKNGEWVVAKSYLGDKVFFESEFDGSGRVLKNTGYYAGDTSKTSYIYAYNYDEYDSGVYFEEYTSFDEEGNEDGNEESRYEIELDGNGKKLSVRSWSSSEGALSEEDIADEKAFVTTYKYDSNGAVREWATEDPEDSNRYSIYVSGTYDTVGYVRQRKANQRGSSLTNIPHDQSFDITYDDNNVPQSVEIGGTEYTFDTDNDGNIVAVYDHEGKLLRQYEYKYISNPTNWTTPRSSVYLDYSAW